MKDCSKDGQHDRRKSVWKYWIWRWEQLFEGTNIITTNGGHDTHDTHDKDLDYKNARIKRMNSMENNMELFNFGDSGKYHKERIYFSTRFVGKPEGGQQCIFDLFWLFFSGGSIQIWGIERHQRGLNPTLTLPTNRALIYFRLYFCRILEILGKEMSICTATMKAQMNFRRGCSLFSLSGVAGHCPARRQPTNSELFTQTNLVSDFPESNSTMTTPCPVLDAGSSSDWQRSPSSKSFQFAVLFNARNMESKIPATSHLHEHELILCFCFRNLDERWSYRFHVGSRAQILYISNIP